ncbi:MAG: hypothetical protein IJO50_05330 [Clostridia bacterium]|nr:hypothetical protein [Clostridia bacterium]
MKGKIIWEIIKITFVGGAVGCLVISIICEAFMYIELGTVGHVISFIVSAFVSGFIAFLEFLNDIKCPQCGKFFSMEEIDSELVGTRLIHKDVDVPDTRTYRVNGKVHVIHETRTERLYANANVYHCTEKCKFCHYERVVERM